MKVFMSTSICPLIPPQTGIKEWIPVWPLTTLHEIMQKRVATLEQLTAPLGFSTKPIQEIGSIIIKQRNEFATKPIQEMFAFVGRASVFILFTSGVSSRKFSSSHYPNSSLLNSSQLSSSLLAFQLKIFLHLLIVTQTQLNSAWLIKLA